MAFALIGEEACQKGDFRGIPEGNVSLFKPGHVNGLQNSHDGTLPLKPIDFLRISASN
jgi:hypothetical protein